MGPKLCARFTCMVLTGSLAAVCYWVIPAYFGSALADLSSETIAIAVCSVVGVILLICLYPFLKSRRG